ncbi:uncharacterized protein LOC134840585 [Symsagittifera roscoffensis]|uniref:uncharacterized protein LOC134840585 n=1 Tax=Symsagittifera roscoffensis TaxID=84072 RepID=UPI00307C0691
MFYFRGVILWVAFTACTNLVWVGALTQMDIRDKTQLQCSEGRFVITMNKSLALEGVGPDETFILYVGSPQECNYTANVTGIGTNNDHIYLSDDGNHYIFNFTFPECLSTREYKADNLYYYSTIVRDSCYIDGQSPMVTRIVPLTANVQCLYNIGESVSFSQSVSVVEHPPIYDNLEEDDILALKGNIYRSNTFSTKRNPGTAGVILVTAGTQLYVQTEETKRNDDYEMVAENCTLANNTNLDDPATGQETILEEFCPVQTVSNSSYNPMPATSDVVRFSTPAEGFFESVESAYIICSYILCEPNGGPSSLCTYAKNKNCSADTPETSTTTTASGLGDSFDTYYEYVSRERVQVGPVGILGTEQRVLQTADDGGLSSINVGPAAGSVGAGVGGAVVVGAATAGSDLTDACAD